MSKKTVEYAFDVNQMVITPFKDDGIITTLATGEAGSCYFVKTANNSQWYKESELTAK